MRRGESYLSLYRKITRFLKPTTFSCGLQSLNYTLQKIITILTAGKLD